VARLRATIRSDGLVAELHASAGPPMTVAEVQAVVKEAKIVHGLDENVLADFVARLADPKFVGHVAIAQGQPAVQGSDGFIAGAFLVPKQPGREHTDGHIDYHERDLLHPAVTDESVATITAPTAGIAGRSVLGQVLPSKAGKPHSQRFGPGVRVERNGVIAARSGVILHTDRLFDVVPLHVHKGNVDLASGNLHTHGSLQVQGDVCEGCKATADGHVHITGAVFDALVEAGASVRIDQGVLGGTGRIVAVDDIACRHATSARLQAGQVITIGDQATHCRMQAEQIVAMKGRGIVFGGELRSRKSIEVRTAGTPTGAVTLLSAGDLLDEQAELAPLTAEAARLDRVTVRGQRSADARSGAKGLRMATKAGDRLQQERLRLLAKQRELLRTAYVHIADVAHPGVVLQFGTATLRLAAAVHATTYHFDLDQDTIVQGDPP
jgi:uncharacterized protein